MGAGNIWSNNKLEVLQHIANSTLRRDHFSHRTVDKMQGNRLSYGSKELVGCSRENVKLLVIEEFKSDTQTSHNQTNCTVFPLLLVIYNRRKIIILKTS